MAFLWHYLDASIQALTNAFAYGQPDSVAVSVQVSTIDVIGFLKWLKDLALLIPRHSNAAVLYRDHKTELLVVSQVYCCVDWDFDDSIRLEFDSIGEQVEKNLLQSAFVKNKDWIELWFFYIKLNLQISPIQSLLN